ncbi:V-type ATP synthase subunit F [Alkalibacter rhizosphaerae]|uniref:V-type ATP synthase subunit F n=1 Tax=Alkalibacter rhizosphaerae TaxID=2815577 RepID=A0A975AH79_9FIRM|nr:V-type ATP synthase subunit F [Alkalibacter rhizosphaerae]QSX08329.1 V-type ATP synthase subunit F [Alkalibacter rhizosphaerae]
MKSYFISDNRDTYVGLRLAGMAGEYLQNLEEAASAFKQAVEQPYGMLFITEKVYNKTKNQVIAYKERHALPLVTVIPDRHGYEEKESITDYIKDSIGL